MYRIDEYKYVVDVINNILKIMCPLLLGIVWCSHRYQLSAY